MKKKNLKSLKLNKKTVSKFNSLEVHGGVASIPTFGIICTITIPISVAACTKWDGCDLPTIGHDDGPNCLSQDPDDWCGGR